MSEEDAPAAGSQADIYLVAVGDGAAAGGFALAEKLRDSLPGLRLQVHTGGGSFKSQMKKADRSGAALALVVGEQELATATVGFKPLRGGEQRSVDQARLAAEIQEFFVHEED